MGILSHLFSCCVFCTKFLLTPFATVEETVLMYSVLLVDLS